MSRRGVPARRRARRIVEGSLPAATNECVQMAGGAVSDYIDIFIPGSLPSLRLARFNQRYGQTMIARLYERNGDEMVPRRRAA